MRALTRLGTTLSRHRTPYLLLLPSVAYLVSFTIYPILNVFYLSLTDLHLVKSLVPHFIGLKNYVELLRDDPDFRGIFLNTLIWTFGSTALQFCLGLATGLILNARLPARGFWRGIMLVPWVTPIVVVGIIWRWIYDGSYGLLNYYLQAAGLISRYVVWLGEDATVWPALLLASLWKGYPYMCLMLLAGLQTIPQEIYEAADVDGASGFRRLWYITLPMLKPVAGIVTLVALVLTWNNFQMIWVLTEGGPAYATSVLATYVFTKGFVFFQLGSGSAVAGISTLVVLVLCVLYARMLRLEERAP
ncbi:MAG: sugar ABC transporter permease [candidate division NC10 bacterium]